MSELPQDPAGLAALVDRLEFEPDAAAELPPPLDPGQPVTVVRSLRWPAELDARIKAVAKARGVSVSQLIRDWIELELTTLESDQPISRADALRALAALRPLAS